MKGFQEMKNSLQSCSMCTARLLGRALLSAHSSALPSTGAASPEEGGGLARGRGEGWPEEGGATGGRVRAPGEVRSEGSRGSCLKCQVLASRKIPV